MAAAKSAHKRQKHDFLVSEGYVEGELPENTAALRLVRTGYSTLSKRLRGVQAYTASPTDAVASNQARWPGAICVLHKTLECQDDTQAVSSLGRGAAQQLCALYALAAA